MGIEKKSSKAVKEFVVICDGPSTVPIFHFRLEEWQLSREALLNKETRNKIRKSIKDQLLGKNVLSVRKDDLVGLSSGLTKEPNTPICEEIKTQHIKSICEDVTITAVHEVAKENEKEKTKSASKKNESSIALDNSNFLKKGDGDVNGLDTQNGKPNLTECPENRDEILIDVTKDLCNAAISSAVYEIAKENIDTMLSSTKEEVHDSDIPIAVKTTEDENNQQTRDNALELTSKQIKQQKRLEKAKAKENVQFLHYQKQIVRSYIEMVNKRYKQHDKMVKKAMEKQTKEEEKRAKEEKKQRQIELKKEKRGLMKNERDRNTAIEYENTIVVKKVGNDDLDQAVMQHVKISDEEDTASKQTQPNNTNTVMMAETEHNDTKRNKMSIGDIFRTLFSCTAKKPEE